MEEIKLNSGTLSKPTVLDKPFQEDEYVILESGVYVLCNDVKIYAATEKTIIAEMWGSSQVKEMRESSQVKEMRGSSQVKEMWGSSQVKEMWGSSQVKEMRGSGLIGLIKSNNVFVNSLGYNTIRLVNGISPKIETNSDTTIVRLPSIENNFDYYRKSYPVKVSSGIATLYKAVHKYKDGTYHADYDNNFTYEIGTTAESKCDSNSSISCSYGIHIAHLAWAVNFGKSWSDMAILECQVTEDELIIGADCDGKIRHSEVLPVRELDKSEYEKYL
jgi:hypothetical protein